MARQHLWQKYIFFPVLSIYNQSIHLLNYKFLKILEHFCLNFSYVFETVIITQRWSHFHQELMRIHQWLYVMYSNAVIADFHIMKNDFMWNKAIVNIASTLVFIYLSHVTNHVTPITLIPDIPSKSSKGVLKGV